MVKSDQKSLRARDLGIKFEGNPGQLNAINDIEGIEVGHTTMIRGDGPLVVGEGPVRTGVSIILPRGKQHDPVFAGWYSLNGNGEMTGTTWVEESGFLEGPIALTNTHSVGAVRDSIIAWQYQEKMYEPVVSTRRGDIFWSLPVVAETYDGILNDINGFHVQHDQVLSALKNASPNLVEEGNVGGGTGMICHGFKGGIGTASRVLATSDGGYALGVIVQANHGDREDLTIKGIPVGRRLPGSVIPDPSDSLLSSEGKGSIIAIVATNAPLLPHQLKRITRRIPMGISRLGSHGEHYSGDIFIAFSTANPAASARSGVAQLNMLSNDKMTPLFDATVQAVEESIMNALVAAQTMTGINGNMAYALPHDNLVEIMQEYG